MMNENEYKVLPLDVLQDFAKHMFKPYSEEKLGEMAESIKANGVLVPIIVRPLEDGRFEILSGHNRTKAARLAGQTDIKAIVRADLSDEEAMFIVAETNLHQRSFTDMSPAEKAVVISQHYEALKSQGRRLDLLEEVDEYLGKKSTSGRSAKSSSARDDLAKLYELSSHAIAQYIRADKLCDSLKEHFDGGEFALGVAEILSFLKTEHQLLVALALEKGNKINTLKANSLRSRSEKGELDETTVAKIFNTENKRASPTITFSRARFAPYQREGESAEDFENEVVAALEAYRNSKQN